MIPLLEANKLMLRPIALPKLRSLQGIKDLKTSDDRTCLRTISKAYTMTTTNQLKTRAILASTG